ncbi:MAG TPA: copper resistance protein NlpE [Candidatus Saccharimonadales bacterium]|nr:copper resistance protein NlpE [Candidatus Saccharimonadales bacterium]
MKNRIMFVVGIFLVLIVCIGVFLLFSQFINHQKINSENMNSEPTPLPTLVGIPTSYTGILPCADCSGLKMDLMLYRNNPSDTAGAYNLQETYLGTKTQPYDTRGKWKIIKGDKKDQNAQVFFLSADNSRETEYFLKINEEKIKLLNKQLAEIQSSSNYTLTKSSH